MESAYSSLSDQFGLDGTLSYVRGVGGRYTYPFRMSRRAAVGETWCQTECGGLGVQAWRFLTRGLLGAAVLRVATLRIWVGGAVQADSGQMGWESLAVLRTGMAGSGILCKSTGSRYGYRLPLLRSVFARRVSYRRRLAL